MTLGERVRFEHIISERPFAPLPTVEDIRILLREVDRLERALEAAVRAAADSLFDQTMDRQLRP